MPQQDTHTHKQTNKKQTTQFCLVEIEPSIDLKTKQNKKPNCKQTNPIFSQKKTHIISFQQNKIKMEPKRNDKEKKKALTNKPFA